jgi:hypothetical protein
MRAPWFLCVGLLAVSGCLAAPPVTPPTLSLPALTAPPAPVVQFKPVLPTFQARPSEYPCTLAYPNGQERTTTCLKVLKDDIIDVIREFRKSCIALGWLIVECEIHFAPRLLPADKPYDQEGIPGTGA